MALKSASRMAMGATVPALAMEQEQAMLSFGDASWDRLFCAAPSSGMCLTNISHSSGAGWDSSSARASLSAQGLGCFVVLF